MDLNKPIRPTPGQASAFIDAAVCYTGFECLIWPFGLRSEYPSVHYRGRSTQGGHRLVCELTHGPSPTKDHYAAHSCGNRTCIAPAHLRWATPTENQADRLLHDTHGRGLRHPNNRLTEADVRAIRAKPDQKGVELAVEYNVGATTISAIRSGKIWSWLD
jgi:hypothetical protein